MWRKGKEGERGSSHLRENVGFSRGREPQDTSQEEMREPRALGHMRTNSTWARAAYAPDLFFHCMKAIQSTH